MKKILAMLSAVALLSGACGQEEEVFNARKAPAPVYAEKADGSGDSADTSCRVVLRSVARIPNNQGGYMTSCDLGISSSQCLYVWEGFVDVDASRIPASVEVLYRTNTTHDQWYSVAATDIGEGESGFRCYRFVISEHTPGPGMSMTSLNRTVIELIPYAVTFSGGRIFDHNRIADPFGNYRLDLSNYWSVFEDEHCMPKLEVPEYRFFRTPWRQYLTGGKVYSGGQVKIVYDPMRLLRHSICWSPEQAMLGTDIYVSWKFDNGSFIGKERVAYYDCPPSGNCQNGLVYRPVIDIPYDARKVEFWFYCAPVYTGRTPMAYDSNNGQNFVLEIEPSSDSNNWPSDFWAGNFLVNISRGATDPCEGGAQYNGSFTYDSWASTRATVRNFCFDVWKQGVTDWDNPDIWKQLDVQVHYYFEGEQQMRTAYVNMVYRTGNNARYALDLGGFNPFAIYHCPDVPYTTFEQNGLEYWRADYYFYFTVNGYEVRPEGPNSFFHGIYIGENTAWHEENCR